MKLWKIGYTFLKKSKALTITCMAGVLFSTLVLVFMYHFYYISQKNYIQNLKDTYGDCDFLMTLEDYESISEELEQQICRVEGVGKVDLGHWGYADVQKVQKDKLSPEYALSRNVYTVGVEDSAMNKSRYQYSLRITDENMAVNAKLAEDMQLEIGDKMKVGSAILEIHEIICDDNFSLSNMGMIVVSQKNLCDSLGEENRPNYMLIKKIKGADITQIMEDIKALDFGVEILSVEQDEQYQKSIKSFRVFMTVLLVIIVVTGGLLIASVFGSFLKKYLRDMMIVKTIGGNQKQVIHIFMSAASILTGIGCLLGYIISVLGGNLLFGMLVHTTNLSPNAAHINIIESLVLVMVIYVLLNLFLYHTVVKFAGKLPLQAVRERETGMNSILKKQRGSAFLAKICRKDFYIALKLLMPKLKENICLIITIAMLTMFSYVSGNAIETIAHNNSEYYRNLYLTECMITNGDSLPIKYNDMKKIYEILEKEDSKAFFMADTVYFGLGFVGEEDWVPRLNISILEKMYHAGVVKMKKDDYTNCVVLGGRVAETIQAEIGNTYCFDVEGSTVELQVVGILQGYDNELIIDEKTADVLYGTKEKGNVADVLSEMGWECSVQFFLAKKEEEIKTVVQSLQFQYPNLTLGSYSNIMEQSEKILKERFFMLQFVLYILTLLVGFGWLNSARNMILSRQKEYVVLRKLGMSERRVQKVIWRQIMIYMLLGIVIGTAAGVGIETWLWYRETEEHLNLWIGYDKIVMIIAFMIFLTVLLRRIVVRVSRKLR